MTAVRTGIPEQTQRTRRRRILSRDAVASLAVDRLVVAMTGGRRPDSKTAFRLALRAARAAGVTLADSYENPGGWDGRTLSRAHLGGDASILYHELGHYLVCPDGRLGLPDFGLGPNPFGRTSSPENAAVHYSKGEEEEEKASLCGILLMAEDGLNCFQVLADHNWTEFRTPDNLEVDMILPPLLRLVDNGVLTADGVRRRRAE